MCSGKVSLRMLAHPLPKTRDVKSSSDLYAEQKLVFLCTMKRSNICTAANLNDGVGLTTCERTLCGQATKQCCPWTRVVKGCHCETGKGVKALIDGSLVHARILRSPKSVGFLPTACAPMPQETRARDAAAA